MKDLTDLFVGERTVFRHSHPEQSVARGLIYTPLVRSSNSGFLAPVRRALHPVLCARTQPTGTDRRIALTRTSAFGPPWRLSAPAFVTIRRVCYQVVGAGPLS